MPETPEEHPVEFQSPTITTEDLCYSYEIEGSTCQVNEQGNIIVDGQTSGIENDKYFGIIEARLAQGITEKLLTKEAEISYLMENTQRMPFSQIRRFIPQGISLVVIGPTPYITSPIKNFKKSKKLQIYDLLKPVIQKAIADGRFTKLQAATIAKELGYPDIAKRILKPTISIKTATEALLNLIGKQQQALLGNPRILEDITSILLTRKEPELKSYLGTKKLAMASFDKGLDLEKTGQTKEAIQAYLEAINLDPQGKYYSFLGSAFRKLRKLDEAVKAYQKAAKADPADYLYQLQLADALEKIGQTKTIEAIAAYRGVAAGYGQIIRTKRPSHIPEREWRHLTETLQGRIRTISRL